MSVNFSEDIYYLARPRFGRSAGMSLLPANETNEQAKRARGAVEAKADAPGLSRRAEDSLALPAGKKRTREQSV